MRKMILAAIVLVFSACSGDVEQEIPRPQAQPVSVAPVQTSLAADVAMIDTVPTPIEVAIEVSVTELPDKRVRIHGTTNLPTATHFMLSVQESAQGGFYGQSQCSVAADGSFDSDAFGPAGGLKDGVYVAEILMPLPSLQPDSVKKIIGANAEWLSGPLVGEDLFGVSVSTKKEFTIGGERGVRVQQERIQERLRICDEWLKKVAEMHARLQAAPDSADFEKWVKFARQFRSDLIKRNDEIDQIESALVGLKILLPLDSVRQMFDSIAFENDKEYNEASMEYAKTLKELEQFINELKSNQ